MIDVLLVPNRIRMTPARARPTEYLNIRMGAGGDRRRDICRTVEVRSWTRAVSPAAARAFCGNEHAEKTGAANSAAANHHRFFIGMQSSIPRRARRTAYERPRLRTFRVCRTSPRWLLWVSKQKLRNDRLAWLLPRVKRYVLDHAKDPLRVFPQMEIPLFLTGIPPSPRMFFEASLAHSLGITW
jgi:hypothetical protein